MTASQKYRELVEVLERVGVMQADGEWAEEIQKVVAAHKQGKSAEEGEENE